MPKGTTRSRDIILGLIFFGGLFGLGYVTTNLSSLPGVGERQYLSVLFEDVYGVREEDSVLIHGTRYGKVKRIIPVPFTTWTATGRDLVEEGITDGPFLPNVMVLLELESPVQLREGYGIYAEDTNLLGGKNVVIDPGSPLATPLDDIGPDIPRAVPGDVDHLRGVVLLGAPRPHPLNSIGKMFEDEKGDISRIIGNLADASDKLNQPDNLVSLLLDDPSARQRVDDTLTDINTLFAQTREEDNLIHDLFFASKLREDLNGLLADARAFVEDARRPETVIGRLTATDSPWRGQIDEILAEVESFTTRANRADTLLGKLIASGPDSLGDKADSILTDVNDLIAQGKTNQQSLIYQMFYGDLGAKLGSAATRIDDGLGRFSTAVLDPIEEGRGILGYLINDPDAKQRLDRLLNAALGIVEDAREAAPVTSLGSFIFGAF